ncbi:hypothetical protein H5410_039674 [Solanum commersonii]|uniref:Uncharacterized protein n=1 Tax=Solanum commersonii TaxID=4109 RepID=A0A9J5XPX1_SOLCO|nr:hypothetical protein H5410_039674 [Solanum commersonii]
MVEVFLFGIVLGLIPISLAGLFLTAYLQYRRVKWLSALELCGRSSPPPPCPGSLSARLEGGSHDFFPGRSNRSSPGEVEGVKRMGAFALRNRRLRLRRLKLS